jgi:uncharacterized RDD family membrane protein YckC
MNQPMPGSNPYAAPEAHLREAPAADGLVLAERGTRLGAVLLDGLIFAICYVPLVIGIAVANPQISQGQSNQLGTFVGVGLGSIAILGLLVYNCILLHRDGQTIAKRWLGIRIVRSDGGHVGLGRIIVARILPTGILGAIPFLGAIVSLTDALMIFRDDRRCLHDLIADTIVVKA